MEFNKLIEILDSSSDDDFAREIAVAEYVIDREVFSKTEAELLLDKVRRLPEESRKPFADMILTGYLMAFDEHISVVSAWFDY
jgi:hypothetical protein